MPAASFFHRPLIAISSLALAVFACNAPSAPPEANGAANGVAPIDVSANADGAPLAGRAAPEPLTSGKPLAGEWDPKLMTVTLAGEALQIQDSNHVWPLKLDESTYDFVRQGMAMFGTPVLSHSVDECPAGKLDYLTYANGLELAFQNGKLTGYWVREGSRGIFVGDGIHPGSPRTALGNAPVQEASFGKLVTVDGTTAILDEQETKITDLYAGAACIFD